MAVATLGAGRSFGELALLNQAPRSATIEVVEPSTFIILDKQDYKSTLALRDRQAMEAKLELLCQM